MDKTNFGLLIEKEIRASDFVMGGETGITHEVRQQNGNWLPYLPTEERQSSVYFDTMACVTFSGLNAIETQVNQLISNGRVSQQQIQRIRELGFFDQNGLFNASDRFNAFCSGTTRNGNYFTRVGDSFRNDGLLPQSDFDYPINQKNPVFDWNDFYIEPGKERREKAKEILKIFDIKYEWVLYNEFTMNEANKEKLRKSLEMCPIWIGTKTCPGWSSNGVVQWCNSKDVNHATLLYSLPDYFDDFDHYSPFRKKLAFNYAIPYALRLVVTVKDNKPVSPIVKPRYSFTTTLRFGMRNEQVKQLQAALQYLGYFPLSVNCTGYYGTITQAAVKKFQEEKKVASVAELLFVNGKTVGPKTRNALNLIFN